MLRYVFLSVFALLLLTACGGNDLNQFKQSGFNQCVECDFDLTPKLVPLASRVRLLIQ